MMPAIKWSFSTTEAKGGYKPSEKAGCEDSRTRESKAMINIKLMGCVLILALIGVTAVAVRPQYTAADYVSPSEAVPTGKAPKMQVQLLTAEEPTKQYAVIFYQGDEAFSGLQEFA